MKEILILSLLLASLGGSPLAAQQQQLRRILRTNQQGQIIRFTVDENRRILRKELVGNLAPAAPEAPPQEEPQPIQLTPRNYPPQADAPPQEEPQQNTDAAHLIGFSLDFLTQNGRGFSRLSTQLDPTNINTIYAGDLPLWALGNAAVGISVGFNYTRVFQNYMTFLFQIQFDTTGWAFVEMNFGLGLRIPVHPRLNLLIDAYFCTGFMGAELPSLEGAVIPAGSPASIVSVVSFFGFKGRIAFEVPLPKNTYIAFAVSYTAYPWALSFAPGTFLINERELSSALAADALKIGIEFGWRIGARK